MVVSKAAAGQDQQLRDVESQLAVLALPVIVLRHEQDPGMGCQVLFFEDGGATQAQGKEEKKKQEGERKQTAPAGSASAGTPGGSAKGKEQRGACAIIRGEERSGVHTGKGAQEKKGGMR